MGVGFDFAPCDEGLGGEGFSLQGRCYRGCCGGVEISVAEVVFLFCGLSLGENVEVFASAATDGFPDVAWHVFRAGTFEDESGEVGFSDAGIRAGEEKPHGCRKVSLQRVVKVEAQG